MAQCFHLQTLHQYGDPAVLDGDKEEEEEEKGRGGGEEEDNDEEE